MVPLLGKIGFGVVILLALAGIASVTNRFVGTVQYLADPERIDLTAHEPPGAVGFEGRYYAHPYVTLVHVTSGFLFMLLGPLQFVAAIRDRWLGFHRWCGRVFLLASLVGVATALLIVAVLPVYGSLSTSVAVVVASTFFFVALVQGYRHIRRREIAEHREWMIRLLAIGLGISSFRVLLPLFMAPPLNATFDEAWNTVVWLGFIVNVTAAEVWIHLTRSPGAIQRPAPVRMQAIEPHSRRELPTADAGALN